MIPAGVTFFLKSSFFWSCCKWRFAAGHFPRLRLRRGMLWSSRVWARCCNRKWNSTHAGPLPGFVFRFYLRALLFHPHTMSSYRWWKALLRQFVCRCRLPGSAKESQLRCLRSDYLVMISCKYFYISSQPFSESIRLRGMRFRGCFFIHYILICNAEKLFLSLQINFHKNIAIWC